MSASDRRRVTAKAGGEMTKKVLDLIKFSIISLSICLFKLAVSFL